MEKNEWSIAEARLHLSEVIKRARKSPQYLENRGKAVAAIIDAELLYRIEGKFPETQGQLLLTSLAKIISENDKKSTLAKPLKSLPQDPFILDEEK